LGRTTTSISTIQRAKRAFEAIDTATRLGVNGSPVERDYVAAMATRYSQDPKADRPALARRYSQAMADLVRRYPEDLDAATLYAESLMNLRPWKLMDPRWQARRGYAADSRDARVGLEAGAQPHGRQPLLHSRGRSVGVPGARVAERRAS
jgi:hypothetical protein